LQGMTHIILFLFIPTENANFFDISIQKPFQHGITE